MRNLLAAAEGIEKIAGHIHGDPDAALARFGADILGRAIGHEMARERRLGIDQTLWYSNLIHETDHTATRKVMAFTAAREVMAGA